MKLFDPDGPLMIALGKLADLVICNMMFIVFSLPIFTIGASLSALYTCTLLLAGDDLKDDGLIFRTFWFAFKENFKKATLLWLICLAAFLFFGAYYWVVRSLAGGYGRVYLVTFFLLALLFLCGFLYLFPLQAHFENSIRNTLRNAWLLSVGALPITVLLLALLVGAIYVSFIMNPAASNVFAYLWAVCGFALLAYLQSFLFLRAFRKPGWEKQKRKGTAAEGAIFIDEEHQEQDLMVQESSFSDPNWNRREDILGEDRPKPRQKRRR